jgi:glycosyltransferase involved in cell wall biosynthesis
MASGTPVVASGTSSIPEVGGEAVGYFDPLDIDAIDSAMTRVLTDRRLHASMASAGLERAAGFSWDETARVTMDIIVECAEEGRS